MTPRVDERKTSRTAVEIRVKRMVGQSPFSPCSETHLVEKIIVCLHLEAFINDITHFF